jgi:uncharacterized protein with HEPN domain
MRGMRNNVVVHEYSSVSTQIIWRTVTRNLPSLAPMLQELLKENT